VNDHEPADILRFMNQGLRRWREHRPHGVTIRDDEVAAPWAATPPPGAAVVRVYSRIRPLPADVWGLNRGIGRDFLWIYPDDIAALIAASGGSGAPGADVRLPPALVGRILRFHLVDDVRGTPMMWGADDVNRADVHARVVRRLGTIRTLAFSGEFAMHRPHLPPVNRVPRPDQTYAGRIEGELDVDVSTARVLRFRAFGDGSAGGAGPGTPHPPPGRFRLIVAMVEAKPDDAAARTIPPEAVATDRDDRAYHAATLGARAIPGSHGALIDRQQMC
jgi:hypothetical protein